MFSGNQQDIGVRQLADRVNNFMTRRLLEEQRAWNCLVYGLNQTHADAEVKLTPDLHGLIAPFLSEVQSRIGITVGVRSSTQVTRNGVGIRLDYRTQAGKVQKAEWFLRFLGLVLAGKVSGMGSRTCTPARSFPEPIDPQYRLSDVFHEANEEVR